VQYLDVGHNICMFNENNDEIRKYKTNCDLRNRKNLIKNKKEALNI
jgi:hypothetical protein